MRISRGTPDQLLRAVKNKIAELSESNIVESATEVESDEFFDKGGDLKYWYFTKHGVMPGSVPRGLNILEIVDRPEGSYFLTDRVITTKALNWYDIKERAPEGITSCDRSTYDEEIESATEVPVVSDELRKFPVDEVISLLDRKGYDTDNEQVKNAADAIAEYMDMSREACEYNGEPWTYTLEEWYKDTQQNYPEELDLPRKGEYDSVDSACNSCNIMSTADMSLSVEDQEKLYEIADGYVTSNPVSGDWDTELQHEQQAIADALNISLSDAKQAMIQYLGFDEDDFKITAAKNIPGLSEDDIVTYDTVEAADDVDSEDKDESEDEEVDKDDSEFGEYITALADDVSDAVKHDLGVSDVTWENDDENMYATITIEDTVYAFTIPYADLKQDTSIDTTYILDSISDEVSGKLESVESSKHVDDEKQAQIRATYQYDEMDEYDDSLWDMLESKSIRDTDGFLTEYTLYEYTGNPADVNDDKYICMYGDRDLYPPDETFADFATSNEDEAYEWFENYIGPGDEEDDDIYSAIDTSDKPFVVRTNFDDSTCIEELIYAFNERTAKALADSKYKDEGHEVVSVRPADDSDLETFAPISDM